MEEYNGWSNRQTWTVSLWLANDEGLYNRWREVSQERAQHHLDGEIVSSLKAWEKVKAGKVDEVAEDIAGLLKNEIEEDNPISSPDLYSDLMTSALGEVNWREIAGHLAKDALEELL